MSAPIISPSEARTGFIYGLLAFAMWGFGPVYFKAVSSISPMEVLAHRVIWSVVLLVLLITWQRQWRDLGRLLKDFRRVSWLLVTALLVAANWLTFISAVSQGEIVASSLGYFIIPLFSVLLGVLFFSERLRPLQMIAILLAICGVANQVITLGELPIIALTLAVTFGLYGLIRKKIAVDPLLGLGVETLLLSPFAFGYLSWLDGQGGLGFGSISITMDLLLVLGGLVTTLPLVCFAAAANRLSLTTIGILHYLAPSITFLLAIYLYNEPFGSYQLITFGFIWTALAIFSWEGWLNQRKVVPAFQGV
ncbi:EamA family transporter RarD [Sedimenticola selenatireducens]|uniref:EamA family transporter RarD n=1 Tax=Sedimenticola selenatireducens TaxID=191960 RepID=A0A558DYH1_9GAMM|nr:EamA family transporter RarD [Sedimenticola selenatireducens]TVO71453.1 EamA family transporter RarD [Sedimenticola selenatireducens]TVT66142.1 MAG: EamA family transporter RarD [Sedimenticola selenatireducens]